MTSIYIGAFIALIIVTAVVISMFVFRRPKIGSLKLKLLKISIPKDETKDDESQDKLKELLLMEQLLASLSAIPDPFVFEVSVHNIGTQIYFYLAVPRSHIEFAIRQIHGFFFDARVEEVDDYTIYDGGGVARGGYVTLKHHFMLPIRTYEASGVDTFSPLLSSFSKLEEVRDGASLQIIVKRAPSGTHNAVVSAIAKLRKGEKLKTIIREGFLNDLGKLVKSSNNDKEKDKSIIVDEEAVKYLESKISKPLFSVNIRLMTYSDTEARAEDLLLSLGGSFAQFSSPRSNELVIVKPRNFKKLAYKYVFRIFDNSQSIILNAEELSSIYHLPTNTTNVPHVEWLNTKESEVPDNLPEEGIILGDAHFRGEVQPVRISDEDRRRHFYIIGQTGTGKSLLMKVMASQDIAKGKGVCIIDPNGDLVDDMLALIPEHRIDDVIVFDPGNIDRPLGLNMLEYDPAHPEQKTFIVNEIQSIFNKLFSQETMGPMFEQYMRNALLLLMDDISEGFPTLVEVPRIFTDQAFRNEKLSRSSTSVVIDFWKKEAEKAGGEMSLANMTPYITSKFGNFIGNDYVRPIIGQPKSAFNFRKVMDDGKILLVKLPKGKIGDINADLLGMIITGKLLMAALSRGDTPQEERRDFFFYIDEFQNFTTDSIATILSEARKYRLNLTVAHQFIAQLEDNIRESVFGNVGSMLSFRVGMEDADTLERQFAPTFNTQDLINIENLNGFIRLLVNGQPTKPFNFKIRFPEKGSPAVAEKLIELSNLSYGRALKEVEDEITQRLRR